MRDAQTRLHLAAAQLLSESIVHSVASDATGNLRKNALIDAHVLAVFANLDLLSSDDLSPRNPDHFRNNHAGFMPDDWWEDDPDPKEALNGIRFWHFVHLQTRIAWEEKFSLSTCVYLIDCGSVRPPRKSMVDIQAELEKVWPYQQGVMFLGMNPWRAKFCRRCANRFVAVTPKNIYCTDACFQLARKETKRAWWNEHGSGWRNFRKNAKIKKEK